MKKVCVLIFLTLFLTSNPYLSDSDYHHEKSNIYDEWFIEPVELLYFFWLDGHREWFTSYQMDRVSGNPYDIIEDIENGGYSIATCSIVIHNHLLPTDFSPDDERLFRILTEYGFRGAFLLYTPRGVAILKEAE